MRLSIPYGKAQEEFEVPEDRLLFRGDMPNVPPLDDLEAEILRKLDSPEGTPPLSELAAGKKNIVLLIEDNTRNTPLKTILPVLVGYLGRHGVPDSAISFLTAPGTHRVMTDAEIVEKIGAGMAARFKVFQHDATKEEELVDLGTVRAGDYGVPVHVNRRALEADLLVGLGDIVPHSDAGYSGGAKIVQPGICGFATTSATHVAAALLADIPLGVMENPCRQGMEEVARKVGLAFILNTVRNRQGEVIGIFAGDFVKAHRQGAALAREAYRVDIPEPADVVVVSSSPCDIDYWQAEKGVISAYFAARPGGILVFAAPCPEGLATNHPRFREWLALSLGDVLAKARASSPEDRDADLVSADLAACNSRVREKMHVFIVTDGLCDEDVRILGYERFPSVQAALDEALSRIPGARVGVLPLGGVALPVRGKQTGSPA
jgi:nickel-dependent lactate racemase